MQIRTYITADLNTEFVFKVQESYAERKDG
jgi:hypothetical protein